MVVWDKIEHPVPSALIERSRAAVKRAREAVAVAKEFDRDRQARDAEMRKLRDGAERQVQRLEKDLASARERIPRPPKGRRHIQQCVKSLRSSRAFAMKKVSVSDCGGGSWKPILSCTANAQNVTKQACIWTRQTALGA